MSEEQTRAETDRLQRVMDQEVREARREWERQKQRDQANTREDVERARRERDR